MTERKIRVWLLSPGELLRWVPLPGEEIVVSIDPLEEIREIRAQADLPEPYSQWPAPTEFCVVRGDDNVAFIRAGVGVRYAFEQLKDGKAWIVGDWAVWKSFDELLRFYEGGME